MRRKTAVMFMCLMLLLVGVLSACSGNNSESQNGNNTPGNAPGEATGKEPLTELSLPIVNKPFEIDYWRPNDPKLTASLENFGEMAAYKKKEELTGIKANFIHPPLGQQADQFNLLVATNDMPEVIYYNWGQAVGGPEKMLADGKIIRLNEYIDLYAPNLKKLIESDDDIRKQISLDDGTIYMFPYLRTDALKLNATSGLIIRKDWLDKLNLEVPETIDEWYNVLKAFREQDPNGNGKKDELPFTGNWGPGHLGTLGLFAPAFGVTGFMMKDGDIVYGHIQPEFKEFLETMKKWYAEGLIDPEIMTNDGTTFDYKITNNLAGAYHAGVFSGMGKYFNLMKDTNPEFDLTGAPWPIGPAGKPYNNMTLDTKVLAYGEAITSSAKEADIPTIVQWMDFNYSPEGHMLFNFGIEGESYVMEGDTVKFTDKIMNNPNLTYDQALASYAMSIMDGPMDQDGRYLDALMTYDGQKAANQVWMKADDSLLLPGLRFTDEESRQLASVLTPITTYHDEMMTKFILGNVPLTEFDKYVETIEKMGIKQIVQIHRDAYERYLTR
ncbi:Lipoprotein LipO [Paenibacillus auburnensis]|uniref:Lipoprotein LipO n=1 Tax=Paenibacillus auburnensis TaxID=2905649 RepID=A0ABN8GIH3_9BACL|nr:extracellular solute-binding protein [Paenibacillus auburnensis]CAH1208337.1 Lipoprotein LipO [Paenibacillus auburnensis]